MDQHSRYLKEFPGGVHICRFLSSFYLLLLSLVVLYYLRMIIHCSVLLSRFGTRETHEETSSRKENPGKGERLSLSAISVAAIIGQCTFPDLSGH